MDGFNGDGNTCMCGQGFTPDENLCIDINECDDGTHNCGFRSTCWNQQGHFNCTCDIGYDYVGKGCVGRLLILSRVKLKKSN